MAWQIKHQIKPSPNAASALQWNGERVDGIWDMGSAIRLQIADVLGLFEAAGLRSTFNSGRSSDQVRADARSARSGQCETSWSQDPQLASGQPSLQAFLVQSHQGLPLRIVVGLVPARIQANSHPYRGRTGAGNLTDGIEGEGSHGWAMACASARSLPAASTMPLVLASASTASQSRRSWWRTAISKAQRRSFARSSLTAA